jgi:alkylated DNA repair dioxygenase AlkB
MLDLFDTPIIPGLTTRPDFLSEDEERDLIACIEAASLTPFKFGEWTGKRLTQSFGWKYDFENETLTRSEPLPQWLDPVIGRAAAHAGLAVGDIVQALLIRYGEGAGIGWHKDRPIYRDVIGISLGSATAMRFRRRSPSGWTRASAPLEPRSLYRLSGEVRHDWEHSIAPLERTRYAITLRSFSDKGRRLAQRA